MKMQPPIQNSYLCPIQFEMKIFTIFIEYRQSANCGQEPAVIERSRNVEM